MAETLTTQGSPSQGNVSNSDAKNPEYMAFILVPVFFLLGLLGVLICHVLKRKGYRCTTEAEGEDEAIEDQKDQGFATEFDTFSDTNNDTVGQIVHFIMKNEANTDALTAMVADTTIDSVSPTTPTTPASPTEVTTPLSPGAPPGAPKHTCNHLHTVGGVVGQKSICSRCNQKKWPLVRQHSRSRSPGEVTVLAVGRFRVTKCDPKPVRDRRVLHVSESKGSVPSSPRGPAVKSRTSSDSQEKKRHGSNIG